MTCFLVKVRSCLLAKALMRASKGWPALQHFWYRRGRTCPGSFESARQRLGHLLYVCQRGLARRNILSDRIPFLVLSRYSVDFQSVRKKFDHGLREEFFLSHGSALHIDQRVDGILSISDHLDAGLLGLNLPRKEQGLVNGLAKDL